MKLSFTKALLGELAGENSAYAAEFDLITLIGATFEAIQAGKEGVVVV